MRLYPAQYIDERFYVDGIYEQRFLDFLRRRINSGGVMLDVGANIGNHALYLADIFDEVHCFEPSPKVADRLEENVGLNHARNIQIHRLGLGSSVGTVPFSTDENLALGKFLHGESKGAELLPVTTGDKWIADAGLQRFDYIKIDVEGFEDEVLLGLRETIRRFRPLVSFEYSGQSNDRPLFEAIRSVLAGYEIYEPVLEPSSANSAGKIRFYLNQALNPEILPVTEPANRYLPYLIAVPSDRKDRFDLS